MKPLTLPLLLLLAAALTAGEPAKEILLWPHGAPGSESSAAQQERWTERGKGVVDRAVENVHEPSLTVYLPEASADAAAVVIAPGGAYRHLAIDKEGHDVARWLNEQGAAGFVLKYRLPRTEGAAYDEDTTLADAQRAVELVRQRAGEFGVDPAKVGFMGFSAGGHLAMRVATESPASSRPDFVAPIYPAAPKDLRVDSLAPPTFLVHADDDRLSSLNSVRFYERLKEQGVSAELHIYSRGGHGFGIRQGEFPVATWKERFADWLRLGGWLK